MPQAHASEVVVAGHLCLDMFPQLGLLPPRALETPGHLYQIGALHVTTGGAVPNTGLALHRLGVSVRLIATVGNDLVGEATLEFLRRTSAELGDYIKVKEGAASSYTIVLTRPGLDRTFLHCTGPNDDFSASDIDFALVAGARWFHFGYPSLLPKVFENGGTPLATIMQQARAAGTATSLDFTLPDSTTASGNADWPAILAAALPFVDVFIPSMEEAIYLLRRDHYAELLASKPTQIRAALDEMASQLLAFGPAIVGFKLGAGGLLLYGANLARMREFAQHVPNASDWTDRVVEQRAFQVEVLDATGAGDAAYAGLIQGLLHALAPQEVAWLSCACGAASVAGPDAVSGLCEWTELRRIYGQRHTCASAYLHI